MSVNREEIIIQVSSSSGQFPRYSSEGASGADLAAYIETPITLAPGSYKLVPTGVRVAIPSGYEGQVRPRSGLAARNGITILNTPGTIDSDYRGEIKVILINLGSEPFTINPGDRIAQLVFSPVVHARFSEQKQLEETARGEGGFGSTGT